MCFGYLKRFANFIPFRQDSFYRIENKHLNNIYYEPTGSNQYGSNEVNEH